MSYNNKSEVKICEVCGDKGIGLNFDVLTCESCKCFFRRNAFKELECKFGSNNCMIKINTRKACAKCRLNKCFSKGMKKELILNNEARSKRMALIEQNRKMKSYVHGQFDDQLFNRYDRMINYDSDTSTCSTCSKQSIVSCDSTNNSNNNYWNNSNFQYNYQSNESLFYFNTIFNDMDNSNNVNPYINTIPKSLYDYNSQFNELEYKRFTELMIASNVMFVNKTPITSQVQSVEDFMYAIDVQRINDIKNCVKLLKGLAVFRQQCDHDQLILIKYGALEIHTLRSISYYDYQNEAFNIAIDENNTTVLQLTLLKQFGCDLYNNFKLFLNSLYRLYDMDDNILNLITVIILFNPNRPNLKHQETIKLEQKVYMHLLKRYLTMKYQNDCESSKRYLQLINTLLDLNFYDKRYKESSMSRPTLPALIHEIIVE